MVSILGLGLTSKTINGGLGLDRGSFDLGFSLGLSGQVFVFWP